MSESRPEPENTIRRALALSTFSGNALAALDVLLAERQQQALDIRALNMNVKAARDLRQIAQGEVARLREALEAIGPPPRKNQRANMEYAVPGLTAWAYAAWAEIQRLQAALARDPSQDREPFDVGRCPGCQNQTADQPGGTLHLSGCPNDPAAVRDPAPPPDILLPKCYCGDLSWTVKNYGRVTHKQGCPARTDPWHQGDPFAGCEKAEDRSAPPQETP